MNVVEQLPGWLKNTRFGAEIVAEHQTAATAARQVLVDDAVKHEAALKRELPPLEAKVTKATKKLQAVLESWQVAKSELNAAQEQLNAAKRAHTSIIDRCRRELASTADHATNQLVGDLRNLWRVLMSGDVSRDDADKADRVRGLIIEAEGLAYVADPRSEVARIRAEAFGDGQ